MKKYRRRGGRKKIEIDWISNLPDDVLAHILSFLSTKEAVQTCILSKRWRKTWAIVPVLDFDIDYLSDNSDDSDDTDDADCKCVGNLRNRVARFDRFVSGVLDNRNPTHLNRVNYARILQCGKHIVSLGWLNHVALLTPKRIIVNVNGATLLDFPHLVFSCASLQYLELFLPGGPKTIIRPASVHLPSLKVLSLRSVELHDDFVEKLFKSCLSLERLEFVDCDWYLSGISSDVLKELSIISCHLFKRMRISCSGLLSLTIYHFLEREGISLEGMKSLVDTCITISLWDPFAGHDDNLPVLNLLDGLSNATDVHLTLMGFKLMELVKNDIPKCRPFNNLKNLYIGRWDLSYDFNLVACFLKHSPSLEKLHLALDENRGEMQEEPIQEVLLQREYLHTVRLSTHSMRKSPTELIKTMMKTLDRYVKIIGNIVGNII